LLTKLFKKVLAVVGIRKGYLIGIRVKGVSSEFISPFSKVILSKFSKAHFISLKT
jgi:hypothetical protein